MFLYIRKYEIWVFVEIFLQKLIHMDKPQTPPPPYVDLCGYFTNPLPPPSRSTWFVDVPYARVYVICDVIKFCLDWNNNASKCMRNMPEVENVLRIF